MSYIGVSYSCVFFFFFSSRRRHTRCSRDWSSDVCSSDLRPKRWSRPFMPELDSLRGIAILLVLFFHGFSFKMGKGHLTGVPHLFVVEIGRASCRERV